MTTTTAAPAAARAQPQSQSVGAIALVGNPNSGKSTVFNRLTGIRQRTGNYPGVTVEKRTGQMNTGQRDLTVVDLPGTYSLAAASADERIVVDVLAGHAPGAPPIDLAVCVVDATNLMRHLFLASQISATGVPIVIALNMIDTAREQGLAVDARLLSQRLGVPVVPTAAARGEGIDQLRQAITQALEDRPRMTRVTWPQPVRDAMAYLRKSLPPEIGQDLTDAEVQRMLFDSDSAVPDRIGWSPSQRLHHIEHARKMLRDAGHDAHAVEPTTRYAHLAQWLDGVTERVAERKATGTESIDGLLTHRVAGLVVFVAMMFVVFWSIYTAAVPMMDGIEVAFGMLGDWVGGLLTGYPMLQSMVVDGVIAGVGGVVVFLPQILILFFFIALLEDTGYMARAAYLMDKLFAWSGLNGRSFVPLLSSYACAIPGIMATRTIENPRARLTTILIAPLMSCSARLPVYVLIIGAFVEPHYGATVAAAVLFGMHLLGLVVAGPIAFVLNKLWFRNRRAPFIMEMPPYRVPRIRDVAQRMVDRGVTFLKTAGTVIFAFSVIIWALSYFPRPAEVETAAVDAHVTQTADQWPLSEARVRTLIEDPDARNELQADLRDAELAKSMGVSEDRARAIAAAADQALASLTEEQADDSDQQVAALVGSSAFTDRTPAADRLPRVNEVPPAQDPAQLVADTYLEAIDRADRRIASAFGAGVDHAVAAAYLEQSYLGRIGKTIQPIFAPAGFDWKITVGVVGSFPAREVIIATLGITYALGGDVDEEDAGLIETMRASTWPDGSPVFTIPVAMAIMVFFALCLQCGATVATIARESNWGWAAFAFSYMTVLAWLGAVVTYQVGTHVV